MTILYRVVVGFRSSNEVEIPCDDESVAYELVARIYTAVYEEASFIKLPGTIINLSELEYASVLPVAAEDVADEPADEEVPA